jgi:hypothetical protein
LRSEDGLAPSRALRLAALFALVALPASAQDTHYWSIQYGPVGQLVGGQLIGGVPDLSATFYNPGALALRNESAYLLSTESVQWEKLTTQSEPGLRVLDTSSSRFGAAPSLLAGALPMRWLGEDTALAWSFLTRQKLDVRLGQRLTDPLGAGLRSAAESFLDTDAEEDWGGLTIARPLSPSLGLGVTWYGVYRGQRTRRELSLAAVAPDSATLNAFGVTDAEFSHYAMLLKLGLAWQSPSWNAGLSITTPSLGLFGSGKTAYTLSISGVDANGDSRPDAPILATNEQEDLESEYHSPWAVGLGASRHFGRTRVYASAEWYGAVGRFEVLAVAPDTPGAARLGEELRSVLNAGVGFEQRLSEDVSVYGAFHTDYSASVGSASENVSVSDWNLYHWSGGLSFRFKDNRFTLGASWARGSKNRPVDSPIPPASLPGLGLERDVDIHYSKITILLGFVFGS